MEAACCQCKFLRGLVCKPHSGSMALLLAPRESFSFAIGSGLFRSLREAGFFEDCSQPLNLV